MRSIFIHLPIAQEQAIRVALDKVAEGTGPDEWKFPNACQPTIWCEVTDCFNDWEPGEVAALRAIMPTASKFVQADVTGTVSAQDLVRQIWQALLGAVPDARVADDYTDHFWTLVELRSNQLVEGHPFFDTKGWHDQDPLIN